MRVLKRTDQKTLNTYGCYLVERHTHDIFIFNVKGEVMSVPPMEFTVDARRWSATANRLPSRHILVQKHAALNKMIDDLLELEVIQPSRVTAWSQVQLVR